MSTVIPDVQDHGDPLGYSPEEIAESNGDGAPFWTARPELDHIRTFARARMVSPWATLGVVLARVVAAARPFIVLPPPPREASLNVFIGLVGSPGRGTGSAVSRRGRVAHQSGGLLAERVVVVRGGDTPQVGGGLHPPVVEVGVGDGEDSEGRMHYRTEDQEMREEDARMRLAHWSALARLALGCVAVLTPDAVGRALAVHAAGRPAHHMLVRNVGGRDIALGLGSLLGLHGAAHPRTWLGMAALVDGLDLVFVILNWRNLPERRRWLFAVTAGGSAAAGALLTATMRARGTGPPSMHSPGRRG